MVCTSLRSAFGKRVVYTDSVADIIALRHAMWEKVATRKHKPVKVFPFGPNSHEVMLYGTVDYGKKDGGSSTIDWAARAHLVKQDGDLKMDFYQVYLVSLATMLEADPSTADMYRIPPHKSNITVKSMMLLLHNVPCRALVIDVSLVAMPR